MINNKFLRELIGTATRGIITGLTMGIIIVISLNKVGNALQKHHNYMMNNYCLRKDLTNKQRK